MSLLVDAFYPELAAALRGLPADDRSEVYALSFFVYDEEDDPRRPTLTVGYNTESHYQACIAAASDAAEARWNYAFWPDNALVVLGREGTASAAVVRRWIREADLDYTDQEEEADWDACSDRAEEITRGFVDACCELVRRAHLAGLVEETVGRAVPILVHELEYYAEIAEQTVAANPDGLADEFAVWVRDWI